MNARNILRMFAILLITFTLLMTACGAPAATVAPAASAELTQSTETIVATEETFAATEESVAATEEPAESDRICTDFPPPIEGDFNCQIEGENMVCAIGDNDVNIIIPWQPGQKQPEQSESGAFLNAISLPIGNLEELSSDNDEIKPHRLVINFELVLDPSNPEFYIEEFDPPIILSVRYTKEDVLCVGGDFNNVQLGFWDEAKGYWVSFAQHAKYQHFIDGNEPGGYVWVTISNWGDRHIGFDG